MADRGGYPKTLQMRLPPGYGEPKTMLSWEAVRAKLEDASVYWMASTRTDGRPHVVPRDGLWIDDVLYYGGHQETVHNRNVEANPNVVVHVGDGQEAIIVEGSVTLEEVSDESAEKLAFATHQKYPQYGKVDPSLYKSGVLVLKPRRVMAWNSLPHDATRFVFTTE